MKSEYCEDVEERWGYKGKEVLWRHWYWPRSDVETVVRAVRQLFLETTQRVAISWRSWRSHFSHFILQLMVDGDGRWPGYCAAVVSRICSDVTCTCSWRHFILLVECVFLFLVVNGRCVSYGAVWVRLWSTSSVHTATRTTTAAVCITHIHGPYDTMR